MEIKICCEDMKGYIDNGYIRLHEYEREVVIDTALYDENEVEIDYCPFCGKKIEIQRSERPNSLFYWLGTIVAIMTDN